MPKPIKKRPPKPAREKHELESFMAKIEGFAETWKKQILIVSIAVAVVVVASLSAYFYSRSLTTRAADLNFEGYKLYMGLYEAENLPPEERMNKALESFMASHDIRKSPFSLLFAANCYYELGRYDEAIAALRDLNREFPDDEKFVPLSYYKIAMAEAAAGRPEDALKSLEVLGSYRSDSMKDLALVESARILEALGRQEEAVGKYRAVAEGYPSSVFYEQARLKAGIEEDGPKEGGAEEKVGEGK